MNEPLWAILGPTAAGKTDAALALAEACDAEIVNVDSRQLYIGMDIGTAKPTPTQRARVPHHMIDVITPDVRWDAMRYAREARRAIGTILSKGRRPLVVGGSGFYFAALAGQLHEDLPPRDAAVRNALLADAQTKGEHALWEQLHEHDPETAERLHPRDTLRIVRALEVHALTGEPLSARARRGPPSPWGRWRVAVLTLPRDQLRIAIRRRIDRMIRLGWPDEARQLLAAGYSLSSPGLGSLGYPQMVAHVCGRMALNDAFEDIALRTWQYARRQLTWFRRVPADQWVTVTEGDAVSLLRGVLESDESGS